MRVELQMPKCGGIRVDRTRRVSGRDVEHKETKVKGWKLITGERCMASVDKDVDEDGMWI